MLPILIAHMLTGTSAAVPRPPDPPEEEFGHPRGTLAIVIIFGSLFLLGWLGMYFYMFLQRGPTHP
jgi:hypothetical protein